MDNVEVRQWLDAIWSQVLESGSSEPDESIDKLVDSRVTSIRYALLTQILGKVADPDRSLMYLQSGNQEAGAWNARSFCDAVIVPWVSDNHDVLGTGSEPYASKPLRRPRLERNMQNVRNKAEWEALYDFFSSLDHVDNDELKVAFRRCLGSVARRLSRQSFKYQIPIRASLPQLLQALEEYFREPSGGLRPLVITAAMMEVLGEGFSIFSRVTSQGINEADAASGAPGDVMCYDAEDNLVLAVEVKDRALKLSDVRSSTRKAQKSISSLSNLLFAAPKIHDQEKDSIFNSIETAWASGLNIHRVDIVELAATTFVLLGEEWRPAFLRRIGNELDARGDHAHRLAWHRILSAMTEEN